MRAVIQRVLKAEVSVEDKVVGTIGLGLLVFLGIEEGDSRTDADYICSKTIGLRVFDDTEGVPNLSVDEIGGSVLIVSQFTLCADARKGSVRRALPSRRIREGAGGRGEPRIRAGRRHDTWD